MINIIFVAGVTGLSKWNYDIFGSTLASAEQMEQTGVPGEIQVTANFCEKAKNVFFFWYLLLLLFLIILLQQNHSYSFNERVDGKTKSYFVASKLERTGSSGVFLNYIEANHKSLTFEQFETMV